MKQKVSSSMAMGMRLAGDKVAPLRTWVGDEVKWAKLAINLGSHGYSIAGTRKSNTRNLARRRRLSQTASV